MDSALRLTSVPVIMVMLRTFVTNVCQDAVVDVSMEIVLNPMNVLAGQDSGKIIVILL